MKFSSAFRVFFLLLFLSATCSFAQVYPQLVCDSITASRSKCGWTCASAFGVSQSDCDPTVPTPYYLVLTVETVGESTTSTRGGTGNCPVSGGNTSYTETRVLTYNSDCSILGDDKSGHHDSTCDAVTCSVETYTTLCARSFCELNETFDTNIT